MSKYLTENFDFWFYLSTFGAVNTPKSRPFEVENNPRTLPKQLQNSFEKVQKMTFSTPKWSRMTPQNYQNKPIFHRKSRFLGSFIDL